MEDKLEGNGRKLEGKDTEMEEVYIDNVFVGFLLWFSAFMDILAWISSGW